MEEKLQIASKVVLIAVLIALIAAILRTTKPGVPAAGISTPVLKLRTPVNIDSLILTTCETCNIPDAKLIVKLARFETGNYTSRIFKENKNLFGMKMPGTGSRHTTAVKDSNGYAYYDSYTESIIDLKLYFARYGSHLSGYSAVDNYKDFLTKKTFK